MSWVRRFEHWSTSFKLPEVSRSLGMEGVVAASRSALANISTRLRPKIFVRPARCYCSDDCHETRIQHRDCRLIIAPGIDIVITRVDGVLSQEAPVLFGKKAIFIRKNPIFSGCYSELKNCNFQGIIQIDRKHMLEKPQPPVLRAKT